MVMSSYMVWRNANTCAAVEYVLNIHLSIKVWNRFNWEQNIFLVVLTIE